MSLASRFLATHSGGWPRSIRQPPVPAWPRFARQCSGTAAVEFAFVVAPFVAIVVLVFQVALYHFGTQSLDYATRLAARRVMTGDLSAAAHELEGFKREILCPNLLGTLSCNDIIVNAYTLSPASDPDLDTGIYQFIDARTKSLAAVNRGPASFCLGGPGDYVFLDVAYDMPALIGNLLKTSDGTPPIYLMRSTTLVRSELYRGSASSC